MGLFSVQSPHCDRWLRSWNSRYSYENAFIACCGADCQPQIRLFACSAWLLIPTALILSPPRLLPSNLHSYRPLITLNLSNLRCNYQRSPLYINSFLILHFYMHNFTETSMWCGFQQWLCMFLSFHCVSVIPGTALYQLWPWTITLCCCVQLLWVSK